MHWEALKQMVYAKNWLAKNSDQENQKLCQRNGLQNLCANVWKSLSKINLAKENGLDSLKVIIIQDFFI